jgi:hypothetical protein
MPLTVKAVMLSFCHVARSSLTMMAIFVSNSMLVGASMKPRIGV